MCAPPRRRRRRCCSARPRGTIDATNIDTALPLSSGHSWRDGGGNITSALWSTTTFAGDTLTITFSVTDGAPTVAITDTVSTGTIIMDVAGMNLATGSVPVSGTFGVDTLTVTSTNKAGAVTVPEGAAAGDLIIELFTIDADLPDLPSWTPIANSPFDVQVTFAATGLSPSRLPEPLDLIVTPSGSPETLVAFALRYDALTGEEFWALLPAGPTWRTARCTCSSTAPRRSPSPPPHRGWSPCARAGTS